MEGSEHESISSNGMSQKKWPTTLGSQKDNLPKLMVCVKELIVQPMTDPMTNRVHFPLDMDTVYNNALAMAM